MADVRAEAARLRDLAVDETLDVTLRILALAARVDLLAEQLEALQRERGTDG